MKNLKVDVSVVMAVKNESKYIEQALLSILRQENINFEVIVIDDNSDDDTYDKIQKIKIYYSNLKFFKNPRSGKVSAFNTGVEAASGRFVCLFAGDDIMPKHSLHDRFKLLCDMPNEEMIVGLSKLMSFSEDSKYDKILLPRKLGVGSTSGQSPMMNRAFVNTFFPIPEILPNEDTWLEIAISYYKNIKVLHSDTICCLWRVHDGNSFRVDLPFAMNRHKFEIRMFAYELFYSKFKTTLDSEQTITLKNIINFINLSKHNVFNRYLLSPRITIRFKFRFLYCYNKTIYYFKNKFYKYLTGI